MRIPHVYGSAADVYSWHYNYLNNSQSQVGGGCEVRVYMGAHQTRIYKLIII